MIIEDIWVDNTKYTRYLPVNPGDGNLDGRPKWSYSNTWEVTTLSQLGLPNGTVNASSKYVIPHTQNDPYGVMVDQIWINNSLYTIYTQLDETGLPFNRNLPN